MNNGSDCQALTRRPSKEVHRWNFDEENRLLHLIKVEHKTHKEAAIDINRSTQAVHHRCSAIRQRDESASITWNSELDAAIIDGRRRGLTLIRIAQGIKMPGEAIQSRWQALQAMKKVPEEVLALGRRKPLRDFTPQEDETILRLYVEGKEDKEIAVLAQIEKKSRTEIMKRRRKLVAESSPIYRRLVGERHGTWKEDNDKKKMDALGLAVAGGKYEWMNEGDVGDGATLG